MENEKSPFYDVEKIVSMTECTGIAPTLPQTEEEAASDAAIQAIHKIPPQ